MILLILGLVIFMIPHSLPVVARQWRDRKKLAVGSKQYEGIYSLISLVGLVLIVYGYEMTRENPVFIWQPPPAMRHFTILLSLIAFVIVSAAYVPRNHLKALFGHPMVLGVKVWAIAHLLSNGRLGDILLFGVFLVWSVIYFSNARRYDRLNPVSATNDGTLQGTILTVVAGFVIWAVFAFIIHVRLIGVSPFG